MNGLAASSPSNVGESGMPGGESGPQPSSTRGSEMIYEAVFKGGYHLREIVRYEVEADSEEDAEEAAWNLYFGDGYRCPRFDEPDLEIERG